MPCGVVFEEVARLQSRNDSMPANAKACGYRVCAIALLQGRCPLTPGGTFCGLQNAFGLLVEAQEWGIDCDDAFRAFWVGF